MLMLPPSVRTYLAREPSGMPYWFAVTLHEDVPGESESEYDRRPF